MCYKQYTSFCLLAYIWSPDNEVSADLPWTQLDEIDRDPSKQLLSAHKARPEAAVGRNNDS